MMKITYTLLVSALAAVAAVQAGSIGHDQVVPFAEPAATTALQKVALKFKPQIHISNGCHPYPAVDAAGNTSGGLKPNGSQSAGCKGSGKGTQVYGRGAAYKDVYALMYSWYFPKDSPITGMGHRHDWEHVVVWIDNVNAANPKILAVSPSAHSGYQKYAPPKANTVDGTSVKVDYTSKVVINHALDSTTAAGEKQPLIMWDQMTQAARTALENTNFGDANVPMKDGNFMDKLAKAYYK
ncbi:Npp1-like protein, partial [Globisporangium splendens]